MVEVSIPGGCLCREQPLGLPSWLQQLWSAWQNRIAQACVSAIACVQDMTFRRAITCALSAVCSSERTACHVAIFSALFLTAQMALLDHPSRALTGEMTVCMSAILVSTIIVLSGRSQADENNRPNGKRRDYLSNIYLAMSDTRGAGAPCEGRRCSSSSELEVLGFPESPFSEAICTARKAAG